MKTAAFLKLVLLIVPTVLILSCVCHGIQDPTIRQANTILLSAPVQENNRSIIVNNQYTRVPGCYIACYSTKHLEGLVRINGLYIGPICRPQGVGFQDISTLDKFKIICSESIINCKAGCRSEGNTGKFVGIIT